MTFRSPKLLRLAATADCVNCEATETVVACHANEGALGKGGAHKSHDCMTAELCMSCHDWADGRDNSPMDPLSIYSDRKEFMRDMILRTTIRRFETRQVVVR